MSVQKIAVAQLCSTSSKLDNLFDIARCAGWARKEGCSMIFLPECFGFMGESATQTLERAEPPVNDDSSTNSEALSQALVSIVNGSSFETNDVNRSDESSISLLDGLKVIACQSQLWISAGGMHVKGGPPSDEFESRVYNTHVILDNDGNAKACYRKIHLFDVHIPGKVDLRESQTTAPGGELVVCDSPIGTYPMV